VPFVSGKLSHSVKRASLALDVSLLGQIDPVFQDADEVFLEDIHPLMRLEQILPEFAGLSDESFQGERLQETMSNMSKKFSWSSCMDLAATARQGAFVYSETWDAMKRTFDVDADEAVLAQPLYTDALSQCLRGLELRAEDPGVFAFHHTALVYQPLLEFYTDYVHIHGGLERGDIQYLLFRHLVLGLTCRGLLGLDSESIPLARLVADSFASTIKSAGGERGTEWPHWVPLSYNESIHKDLGINGDKLKG
jgi:hypothetical protein